MPHSSGNSSRQMEVSPRGPQCQWVVHLPRDQDILFGTIKLPDSRRIPMVLSKITGSHTPKKMGDTLRRVCVLVFAGEVRSRNMGTMNWSLMESPYVKYLKRFRMPC
jgi:hypothetical protein